MGGSPQRSRSGAAAEQQQEPQWRRGGGGGAQVHPRPVMSTLDLEVGVVAGGDAASAKLEGEWLRCLPTSCPPGHLMPVVPCNRGCRWCGGIGDAGGAAEAGVSIRPFRPSRCFVSTQALPESWPNRLLLRRVLHRAISGLAHVLYPLSQLGKSECAILDIALPL